MHAYNSLNETQQRAWVQVEQDRADGLLTEKGYSMKVRRLYRSAFNSPEVEMRFSSVETCNAEFEKLRVRARALEKRLKKCEH